MDELKIARVYSESLYELGEEKKNLLAIEEDMEGLARVFEADRELLVFLTSPKASLEEKQALLVKLFSDKVEEVTLDFLRVVVKNRRQDILPTIFRVFREYCELRQEKAVVDLESAVELPESLKDQVAHLLKPHVSGEIVIREKLVPALRGGFIVKSGDLRIDASVKSALAEMRSKLHKLELDSGRMLAE